MSFLYDFHLANGYISSLYGNTDTIEKKVAATYKAFYKKYNTDSIGVRKTLAYYSKDPENLTLIYNEVETKLLRSEKEEQKRMARVNAERERKRKAQIAIEIAEAKIISDRKKMLEGKYDFGLSTYFSKTEVYLKFWKYPVKDIPKTRVDTLISPPTGISRPTGRGYTRRGY